MKKAAIYIVEALMQRLYTVSSTVFDSKDNRYMLNAQEIIS